MDVCAGAVPFRTMAVAAVCGLLLGAGGARGAEPQARPAGSPLTFAESPRVLIRPADAAKEGREAEAVGTVLALAFSPDGTTLAVGGEGPAVEVRETASNRVRARLTGHTEPVACAAFSPDGKTIATGGYDRTVRLWDVANGAERTALPAQDGWVLALAFSPDGGALAVAGRGPAVTLWDVGSGRALASLAGHDGTVRALAFAPGGKALASAGSDRVIRLWDLATKEQAGALVGHRGAVRALAYVDGGATLASAGEDHTVKLWDVGSGKVLKTLADSVESVLTLAAAPHGAGVAAGTYDGTVRVYEVPSGAPAFRMMRAHDGGVTALAFNPTTGALASAGYDKQVKLWAPARAVARLMKTLAPPSRPFLNAAVSPDGATLVAVDGERGPRVWDVATWAERPQTVGPESGAISVAFSADGRRFVTRAAAGTVSVWDAKRLTPLGRLDTPAQEGMPFRRFALAPDGSALAVESEDGGVTLWGVPAVAAGSDGQGGQTPAPLSPRWALAGAPMQRVQSLAFSPDGKTIVVVQVGRPGANGRLLVVDAAEGRERKNLPVSSRVFGLTFSPDGRTFALVQSLAKQGERLKEALTTWDTSNWSESGRFDLPTGVTQAFAYTPDGSRFALGTNSGQVQFWDATTLKPVGVVKAHEKPVAGLSFGAGGRVLVTAAVGEPVKVWDIAADRGAFPWRRGAVLDAAFSPDGASIALACDDGVVRFADARTRRVVREASGHAARVWSVAFSPDGKTVATGCGDWDRHDDTGEIRLWDAATGAPKERTSVALPLVFSVAFSPDGRTLASGGWDHRVRLWDAESLKPLGAWEGHTGSVRRLAFAPGGAALASASFDGTVRFWNPAAPPGTPPVRVVKAHAGGLNALAFSPDGKTFATGGKGNSAGAGELALWDAATGAEKARAPDACRGQLLTLAFSPNGATLATGGGDFANSADLRLWDADTLLPLESLTGHALWVEGLAFSPDGATLVSAGGVSGRTGEVRFWGVAGETRTKGGRGASKK